MGRLVKAAAGIAGGVAVLWPVHARAETVSSKGDFMSAWTGASSGPDSLYAYAGAAVALGGGMDADGLRARIGFGGGRYETDGDDAHMVDHYDADLMLGYRTHLGASLIALYAGASFERHDNDDRNSDIRGSKLGAKTQAELYAPLSAAIYVSGFGNYSTAFDSFNVGARLAYKLSDRVSIGPEAAALGTQGFDQTRTGIASAFTLGASSELAVSAGYAWAMDADDDGGIYGGINLYTRF